MNSRAKGCRGERLWRDELRAEGYTARRGQQFSGRNGGADVVCDELSSFHFEVKFTERGNPYDWIAQAKHDSEAARRLPVVAHKRKNSEWLVMMPSRVFFELVRQSDFNLPREREAGCEQPTT